jgi:hypothetical protein
VVLHGFFFARREENRLDRVSIVSEMYKPGVRSFLAFSLLQEVVSGSGSAGILVKD